MRKFDLSLRSSRSSYFATFRHQLTILSKTDALDEEKWLNMLGTFVKDWFRDRKSGSAGMPRPISYAVFCLKKKNIFGRHSHALDWYFLNDVNGCVGARYALAVPVEVRPVEDYMSM